MSRAYSDDLRFRIVRAVEEEGMSQPQAAARFAVGLASVKRYLHQWRTTGTLTARPHPGRPALSRPPHTTASSRCWRPIPMRPSPSTARGGRGDRRRGEPEHAVPRPAARRLDGEKKSLIATERDAAARAAWRAMAALWDAQAGLRGRERHADEYDAAHQPCPARTAGGGGGTTQPWQEHNADRGAVRAKGWERR